MKILFLLQTARLNKRGLASIKARLTINKSRKEFSTGIFIPPKHWNRDNQKVFEEAENSQTINSEISLIKQKLRQAFLMLQIHNESFCKLPLKPNCLKVE